MSTTNSLSEEVQKQLFIFYRKRQAIVVDILLVDIKKIYSYKKIIKWVDNDKFYDKILQ